MRLCLFLIISVFGYLKPYTNKLDGMSVVAFGDFDGDRRIDFFTLDNSRTVLSVFTYNPHTLPNVGGHFKLLSSYSHSTPITAVILSDFSYNGKLDVLLVCKSDKGYSNTILQQVPDRSKVVTQLQILESFDTLDIPILVDFYGNMKSTLLARDLERKFKVSSIDAGGLFVQEETGDFCPLRKQHSSATIDMNGDCTTDLVLDCEDGLRVFHRKEGKFDGKLDSSVRIELPNDTKTISFIDFDGDGNVDIVYQDDAHLYVMYNSNEPVTIDTVCKPKSIGFSTVQTISFQGLKSKMSNDFIPNTNLFLQFGDYDSDSYPDLLFTSDKYLSYLFHNSPCDDTCTDDERSKQRRTLKPATGIQLGEKGQLTDDLAYSAAFVDFDNKGSIDIILNTKNDDKLTATVFKNTFVNDNSRLNLLMTNAACPLGICGNESNYGLGVSYPGSVYYVIAKDRENQYRIRQSSQLTQSQAMSLQQPNALIGLGLIDNIVPFLKAGSSIGFGEFEFIIPNSDLIVIPKIGNSDWSIKLYINPGKYSVWVFLCAFISMGLCAIIAVILKRQEVIQDKKEKREARHIINFDAL